MLLIGLGCTATARGAEVSLEQFLAGSPHPVLISISADSIVYAPDRHWLYARGHVRYSGRGFVIAAEILRMDLTRERAALSNAEGVLHQGKKEKRFKADVLHLDLTERRAVGTTYGDRIVVERIWIPETLETRTSALDLYFEQLESVPVDAELGPILEGALYLELERAEFDPQSRLRAWGVVPYIDGEAGPRLPFFSFRTGDAQPRQGWSLKSMSASNVSGMRAEASWATSPAEQLMTLLELRYEELSFLDDPFRPPRRARLGLRQLYFASDALEAELGGFYQTDDQWEGHLGADWTHGSTQASLEGLFAEDTYSGRHKRLKLGHKFDREGLDSDFSADWDLGRQLDLGWNLDAKLWGDHLQLDASTTYLNRFDATGSEVWSGTAVASLHLSDFLATLSYFGIQDFLQKTASHRPTARLETVPLSLGGGFLFSAGNQLQLAADRSPLFRSSRLDDEAWLLLQHEPILFTSSLSYDASLRASARVLEGLADETTLEGLLSLTQRFGQSSSVALGYRYWTVRQTDSSWWTLGTVLQELQLSAQLFGKHGKRLLGQGRYSLTEGQALDAFLQFEGDFGPAWKTSLRSGYDFKRDAFNVLDVSVSRDVFLGWLRLTYREVQNELSVDYTAKLF